MKGFELNNNQMLKIELSAEMLKSIMEQTHGMKPKTIANQAIEQCIKQRGVRVYKYIDASKMQITSTTSN